MSYQLFETVMSRCNTDSSISDIKKAKDNVQLIISKVNNYENPEAIKLQAIGYSSSLGIIIGNWSLCLIDSRYLE